MTKYNTIWFQINQSWKCNMNCSYCHVKQNSDRMSTQVIDQIIKCGSKMSEKYDPKNFYFIFLGGEPLLNLPIILGARLFYIGVNYQYIKLTRKESNSKGTTYFTTEKIFSYTLQIEIIIRWLRLDKETGQELFNNLLSNLEKSYEFSKEFI